MFSAAAGDPALGVVGMPVGAVGGVDGPHGVVVVKAG